MAAGAEFLGDISHRYDTNLVAVFFVEQSGRAGIAGCFDVHDLFRDRIGSRNIFIDDLFHLGELLLGELFEMAEVEAQIVGSYEAAGLLDMGAEHFFQGALQQVGAGMIGCRAHAFLAVDFLTNFLADVQRSFFDIDLDEVLGVAGFLHVQDDGFRVWCGHDSTIGNLSAAFGIEACPIEDDLAFSVQRIGHFAVFEYCNDLSVAR